MSDDIVTLRSNPFNEVLRDAAQISGVIVAGVLRHGTAPVNGDTVTLTANLPPEWSGSRICARVLSADGRYEATNEYDLSQEWSGGVTGLPFPTRHGAALADLPPQGLAIQISAGDCMSQLSDTTVALWNPDGEIGEAQILINSFRADEVFMYLDTYPDAIRCNALEAGGMAAFDHACILPDDVSGSVEVTLYRVSGGKPATPSVLKLWIGLDS
ncbi:hypothetical protein KDD17_02635 [Sulfitobacter albidus]|uniref:Uncharacterized protein n=1 Tax=Sulfitobacter albidus TaxID=2829501 RepID=A0A975JEE3_9RHOB|nr:hypothetical protein [Sulfitobacter albidus]QUJ76966.1 hypothetical protein KDD17_02635 [Sulfitobacter albidus]